MAAAYLFHIRQNYAFVDGSKRTAAFAAVLFLFLNGVADAQLLLEEALENLTLALTAGELHKSDVVPWFQQLPLKSDPAA